jgi:hypothetical protein
MAEKTTIARPYAQAIFELADRGKQLPRWSEMLQLAAAVAADARVSGLIGNPRVDKDELTQRGGAKPGARPVREPPHGRAAGDRRPL